MMVCDPRALSPGAYASCPPLPSMVVSFPLVPQIVGLCVVSVWLLFLGPVLLSLPQPSGTRALIHTKSRSLHRENTASWVEGQAAAWWP